MLPERQERALHTRRALLHSAARLFDRHGYARAKLNDISAGAGVSPGALHFHFANKAAVAAAVETAGADILWSAGRIACRANKDALQALTDMSQAFVRLLRWDVVARAGFRLGTDTDTPRARTQALDQEWHTCVERLLAWAARNNELSRDVDLVPVTCAVLTATTGIGLQITGSAEQRAQNALTAFWQVFLPGLATPEVAARLEPAGRTTVVADAVAVSRYACAQAPAAEPAP
ncbi:ScbR family autoregulator-binding transcription factor [Streptomyces sp. B1866]|uniref:ScbR family autoregulator-binding transcription factor n=1 Tax=Streptomyces sp. B1866 TaxID=3075431 RepID=UPI00288C646F|nr:ScbR family autoregulator-binding transcription factor [Streptomyces sp. B1866]MDT3397074.1 ScbR family autoregulator-binding transcription factor [Streptomyces sp. B1866]